MSEAQGGGLIREQFLPNTTPARRESQRHYGENTITECCRFTRELRLFNVSSLLLMFVKRD